VTPNASDPFLIHRWASFVFGALIKLSHRIGRKEEQRIAHLWTKGKFGFFWFC
jgi:hypothetical protein